MNVRDSNQNQTRVRQNARPWFRSRRRTHDPMLVLNMSIFNFEPGWQRIFNPLRQQTNARW
jgi:hypothetical protein